MNSEKRETEGKPLRRSKQDLSLNLCSTWYPSRNENGFMESRNPADSDRFMELLLDEEEEDPFILHIRRSKGQLCMKGR